MICEVQTLLTGEGPLCFVVVIVSYLVRKLNFYGVSQRKRDACSSRIFSFALYVLITWFFFALDIFFVLHIKFISHMLDFITTGFPFLNLIHASSGYIMVTMVYLFWIVLDHLFSVFGVDREEVTLSMQPQPLCSAFR